LFDLGGVVFDFDFRRAFRVWGARASCDPDVLEQRFQLDEPYQQHERGEISSSSYFAALRRSLDIDIGDGDLLTGWNDVYLGVTPGIVELLTAAQERWPLYAFTNSNPAHQSVWAARYADELKAFQTIFVSSELGLRKPDAEAFRFVAGRIGVPPHEILFFDDTAENVEGACRAGMPAVLVTSSMSVRQELSRLGLELNG
jgi:putative hydrolase of the HAD superfamily